MSPMLKLSVGHRNDKIDAETIELKNEIKFIRESSSRLLLDNGKRQFIQKLRDYDGELAQLVNYLKENGIR